MGKIVLLDELTINKIAAGEVIERPASVIKEMVENSIDAGASKITVEIKNGGISYIKVTDDGKGIARDDLEIAFERHATSKIRSADDLDTVTSMGFRGEALASIAAISKVELVSRTEDDDTGYKVMLEAGDIIEKQEAGCSKGTSITVTNLFFNTPVRYKFLKKDYTESGYIEDVITRIALVNPQIAIKLINSGKTVIQTNGNGDLKTVVYSIYGKDVSDAVMDVKYKYDDIEITGIIGKPEIARSNRSNQLFFVNKRYIKDKTLSAATEQAYKGLIPIGKFGFVILNIDMSPMKVDVNVHPAKLEVRFQEESKVFQAIYHSIKDTLLKGELVANTSKEKVGEPLAPSPRDIPFEQRLAQKYAQREAASNKTGLFGFSRQSKKIEEYNEEERKIKTNNILEDIYNNKNDAEEQETKKIDVVKVKEVETGEEPTDVPNLEDVKIGDPFDTSDVLAKLKNLQDELENQLYATPTKIDIKGLLEKDDKEETSKIEKEQEDIVENNEQAAVKIVEQEQVEKIEEIQMPIEENEEDKQKTDDNEIEKSKVEDVSIAEDLEEDTKNKENTEPEDKEEKAETLDYVKEKINELENNPNVLTQDFKEMYAKLFGVVPKTQEDEIKERKQQEEKKKISAIDIVKDNISVFEDKETYNIPNYKFIGIVFTTYIIIEMNKEMYILDQHAAHERIMYEKVKQNYYSDSNKDSQMLLLPDLITLTHKEMEIAKENKDMFQKAGFEFEEFGDNTIKLMGCPNVCIELDTKELFLETLDEINTVARTAKQEKEEKFIATVACKAAVKANMALTKEEVDSLMEKLLQLPNPFTCPHGRPTAIKMTKYDIERKFARK